jgi:hypothetical protein
LHPNAEVLVCVLDQDALAITDDFPAVLTFRWSDVLKGDPELGAAVASREGASAIFTSVPAISKHALSMIPENESITYLDADIALLDRLDSLTAQFGTSDVGLFPHGFSKLLHSYMIRYGRYNAGAFIVRNSKNGRDFLDAWSALCIDWCEDRTGTLGRYSNQGYLTRLAEERLSVVNLEGSAGNIAPWNSGLQSTRISKGRVCHRGSNIVFFHFHGLQRSRNVWLLGHLRYGNLLTKHVIRVLYLEYLESLEVANLKYGQAFNQSLRITSRKHAPLINVIYKLLSLTTLQYIRIPQAGSESSRKYLP